MKDFRKRPQDIIYALQSLRGKGLSVSLPYQTASGVVFFEIDGSAFTVAELLRLLDANELDRVGIRQFDAKRKKDAAAQWE